MFLLHLMYFSPAMPHTTPQVLDLRRHGRTQMIPTAPLPSLYVNQTTNNHELQLLRRDRSQRGQQYRGPRWRFRSPSPKRTHNGRRPSAAVPSSPFQSQQPHRSGRSRSSSPRRSRWDQSEGQEPYQAELHNRPGRPSSSFVSRFQDPRISYNEQSDYRGRERYHAERHSSHHPDSLPAHESKPLRPLEDL
jgi:hypothetical protein